MYLNITAILITVIWVVLILWISYREDKSKTTNLVKLKDRENFELKLAIRDMEIQNRDKEIAYLKELLNLKNSIKNPENPIDNKDEKLDEKPK